VTSMRMSELKRGWDVQTLSTRGIVTKAPERDEHGNLYMVLEDHNGAPVGISYAGGADPEVEVIEQKRPRPKRPRTRDPRTREVKKRLGWS
jgi:hypothetical protein